MRRSKIQNQNYSKIQEFKYAKLIHKEKNTCSIGESRKVIVIILKKSLPIKNFVVIGFNMHAYFYARWRGKKIDVWPQSRKGGNIMRGLMFNVFRGLEEVAFRRIFR